MTQDRAIVTIERQ